MHLRGVFDCLYFHEDIRPFIRAGQRDRSVGNDRKGSLIVKESLPLRYTTDAFDHLVLEDVERRNVKFMLIDSINDCLLTTMGGDLRKRLYALSRV